MSWFQMRWTTLSQTVDVGDAAQRVETVVRRAFCRFPDGAFSRFAVAEQHIGAVFGFDRRALSAVPTAAQMPWPSDPVATSTNESRGVGCPSRSESSRRNVSRSLALEQPDLGPCRVEDRRGVPLGEHEAVVIRVVRVARVVAHFREEQRRDDLGGGRAGGRVATSCFAGRADTIDAQPRGEFFNAATRDEAWTGTGQGTSGNADKQGLRPAIVAEGTARAASAKPPTIITGARAPVLMYSRSSCGSAEW